MQFAFPGERESRWGLPSTFDKATIKKASLPNIVVAVLSAIGILLYGFGLWSYWSAAPSISQATEERFFVWVCWYGFPVAIVLAFLFSVFMHSYANKFLLIVALMLNFTIALIAPIIMYSLFEFNSEHFAGSCGALPNGQTNPACTKLHNGYNSFMAGATFLMIGQVLCGIYTVMIFVGYVRSGLFSDSAIKYKVADERDVTSNAIEELEKSLEMHKFGTDTEDFKMD